MIAALLLAGALNTTAPQIEDTYIKDSYVEYCKEIGGEYDLSPELLESLIEHESSGNTYAENYNSTCFGLCQIHERYNRDRMKRLGVVYLSDPRGNIMVGADLLSELYEDSKDMGLALMRYHGESDAIKKHKAGKLSDYAKSVLKRAEELEHLHEEGEK